ncbi:MAG TPA: GGDEF domain-containing protein [bacterium]|nr:GGDEF domain-containing protein [bacterium]
MMRLIRSLPFLYAIPIVFIAISSSSRQSLSVQIVVWGLFVVLHLYLALIERIALILPAFLPAVVYVADFVILRWGNHSPLIALLFAALPVVYARRPAHYGWYVAASALSLALPGSLREARDLTVYVLFLLTAGAVYLFSREEIVRYLWGGGTARSGDHRSPGASDHARQAVEDPYLALMKYCERTTLWDRIPVAVKVVELRGEEGIIVGAPSPFRLTGLILLAIKNRCVLPCHSILEEKEFLPLIPPYNKRVYFPVGLFDPEGVPAVPEYVIVIDADYQGDKQLLVETFAPIRQDVIELLRMAATFDRVLTDRRRQEKLYRGAREMLDSFSREKLFNASAWSVLNFVPDAATVLITEWRDGEHKGIIYRLEDDGTPLSLEKVAPLTATDMTDPTTIQAMMLEGKVGKMAEIRDINRRRDKNQLFAELAFAELNRHAQMLTFLLQRHETPQGTLSVFLDSDREVDTQTKSDLLLLCRILSSALNNIEMYETVQNLSNIDALTGLYNRRYLQERTETMTGEAARSGMPLSAIMLDIDHFKKVNDRYGHKAGDEVIRFLSRIIKRSVRKVDVAARYGGEEFVLLLHNTTKEGALKVAEKIRETVQGSVVPADGNQLTITSSFGVSSFPELVQRPEDLVKSADEALYESKEGGRNRVTLYMPKGS